MEYPGGVVSNVFEDALVRQGVTSGSQLAERLESPAAIFFFAGGRPYAELRYWDSSGAMSVSKHWPRYPNMTVAACRKKTVEAAQNEAKELLGLEEWSRSPFPNCWLPSSVVEEARRMFMEEPKTA
jgi:hypothetical protein